MFSRWPYPSGSVANGVIYSLFIISVYYCSLWTQTRKHQLNETPNSNDIIFIYLLVYCSFTVLILISVCSFTVHQQVSVVVWCHWVSLIIIISVPINTEFTKVCNAFSVSLKFMDTIFYFSFFNSVFDITLSDVTVKRTRDIEVAKISALINCVTLSTSRNISEIQSPFL